MTVLVILMSLLMSVSGMFVRSDDDQLPQVTNFGRANLTLESVGSPLSNTSSVWQRSKRSPKWCTTDSDCPSNAACVIEIKQCKCKIGYGQKFDLCIKAHCNKQFECDRPDNSWMVQVCSDLTCSCNSGSHEPDKYGVSCVKLPINDITRVMNRNDHDDLNGFLAYFAAFGIGVPLLFCLTPLVILLICACIYACCAWYTMRQQAQRPLWVPGYGATATSPATTTIYN